MRRMQHWGSTSGAGTHPVLCTIRPHMSCMARDWETRTHPSGSGGFGRGAAHAGELVLALRQGTPQAGRLGGADVAAALHVGLELGQLRDRALACLQVHLQLADLRPAPRAMHVRWCCSQMRSVQEIKLLGCSRKDPHSPTFACIETVPSVFLVVFSRTKVLCQSSAQEDHDRNLHAVMAAWVVQYPCWR